MNNAMRTAGALVGCAILLGAGGARAQDWPQWRGPNRDGKAIGFKAPATWPKELTQKWKVVAGDGVATPALVGDRLYVFTRQEGNEVTRCLDAATGKKLWRKDDFQGNWPRFFTSSSPIVVEGLCIAQLGGGRGGALVACDLATGAEKWKWSGDSPAYASPVLLTVGADKVIVTETESKIVGIGAADGKLLWQTPYTVRGRGYNASTPMVDGQTVIYSGSGRGTRAVKLEKQGDALAAKELWSNPQNSTQFNTPVLKDGFVFGLSDRDSLFCINAQDGKTAWTAPVGGAGGRGRSGYGSIVDAGPVLLALTPRAELIVFEPSGKEYKRIAGYKVSDSETYAYPVVASNRVFVKDRDALTLWTID